MRSRTPTKRLCKVAALAAAVTMVVTACGGSAVTDPAAAPGAEAVSTTTEQSTLPADGSAVSGAAAVSGAGAGAAAGATGPGAADPANGGAAPAAGTVGGTTGKPGKNSGGAAGQAATATGLVGAVERTIQTSPIFGGTAACKPATLSPVNIGNVSTLSGVLGELFEPAANALQTFVASQNACGGLNGHPIKFYQEDDQGDPSTAVSKAQLLIQQRKVLAFVGNIQVLTFDALQPTIKSTGIPVIGGDITNNTWFTNPLVFPQGPGAQAVSYGHIVGALDYHKKKNIGNVWCIEVPRACEQINRTIKELSPMLGANFKKDIQVSITAPSYVQQCLDFKNAGVESLALTFDAASMVRFARSCTQVGWFPKVTAYPLAVGNEAQFLGTKWLADAYVPLNTFPWMGTNTPAERYWQASVKKFNPGFPSGGAASLGWQAGALLVAAGAGLSAENPTSQQLIDALLTFKGQKFTTLGGLSPSPITYQAGGIPKVPYCLFAAVSNDDNTGWKTVVSKPTCTKILAPSDPQNKA